MMSMEPSAMPFLCVLLVFYCQQAQYAAGMSESTINRLQVSPRAFSFELLPPGIGTLHSSSFLLAESNFSECHCRLRCLSKPGCRGFGYNDNKDTCVLTKLLPMKDRMSTSDEDWRWYARNGVRQLGEPCSIDSDCTVLEPYSTCMNSVCGCLWPLEDDGARGCHRPGRFISVGTGRFTSKPLSETASSTLEECNTTCSASLTCLAFDFSAADGRCRHYAEGVTADTGSGRDAESFLWSYPRADGTPPGTYERVNTSFLRVLHPTVVSSASSVCLEDNAILFPGVTRQEIAQLDGFFGAIMTTVFAKSHPFLSIGLDDTVDEGTYVTSDGRIPKDAAWGPGEPNYRNENCVMMKLPGGTLHDIQCGRTFHALCEYVGENLALARPSWSNAHDNVSQAQHGNDGKIRTSFSALMNSSSPKTWTVDLGSRVQVTAVLYGAPSKLPDSFRNGTMEIRIGSDRNSFDVHTSARCVLREGTFTIAGYARLFWCPVPLTGRYVRLIRSEGEQELALAELAVFGNRLHC